MMAHCELCPRRCGVNRAGGERGFCGGGAPAEIFRWGPHHGEEPPLSGTRGSGTVFFSRCTLRCLYCQNYIFSQEGQGANYSAEGLAEILGELRAAGCHNWNLVSPTPWLAVIEPALALAEKAAPRLPVVYNTSGYERVETIRALADWVDVYLTDLRYALPASAAAGSGAADYVATARAAFLEMWRQVGPLQLETAGWARSGVIVRLLILPGRAEEACANLRWLAETAGPEVAVSVMAQYTPAYRAGGQAPWNRRISRNEYDRVCRAMEAGGFRQGWVQDYFERAEANFIGYNMPRQDAVLAGGLLNTNASNEVKHERAQ